MSQQSLFDTRREAHAAIEPQAQSMRERVLAFVRERGSVGASDQEIAAGLDMLGDTARARRNELVKEGLIQQSGATRPSRHGGPRPRPCEVWVAADVRGAVRPASGPAIASVVCDRCGFDRFVDVRIHAGRSLRRDCARCGRTLGFPVWHGVEVVDVFS